jgi:hypothetical protein
MNRDFTVKIFEQLLKTLLSAGYTFITFAQYCSFPDVRSEGVREREGDLDLSPFALQNTDYRSPITDHPKRFVILRHDVDAKPLNTLRLAQLENSLGIRGSYYFRALLNGFEEEIISQIAGLGHEIGYHYETINQVLKQQYAAGSNQSESVSQELKTLCSSVYSSVFLCGKKKGFSPEEPIILEAYNLFINNLEKLRRIAPVSTICMHGSPLSLYDNRAIWEKYDYHSLDIMGDPYFDIDFNKMAYLTDTGRRWNGFSVSIRDKIGDFETKIRRDEDTVERGREGARESVSDFNTLFFAPQNNDYRISKHNGDPGQSGPITDYRLPITDYRLPITDNPMPHAPCPMPFHSTRDIIRSIRDGVLPYEAMITLHPQRWTNALMPWLKELIWQNLKNPFKWLIIKIKR